MAEQHAPKPPTADELSYGLPKPSNEAPTEPVSTVRWLTDKKRTTSVELEHPFEVGGLEYWVITIKRLTANEVAAFMTKMRENPDAVFRYPLYYDERGAELSDAAWDALDDDDRFKLTEAGDDFLPARFRAPAEPQAPGSVPATGATSDNFSAT